MKQFCLILYILLIPCVTYAQFASVGGQYSQESNGQFALNLSYPVFHKKNKLNSYISSGVDYTTHGGAKISGLNIKPIQITTFFGENFFNTNRYSLLFNMDGGYLLNLRHGKKNGIVLTPSLYFDYSVFFVKAGYDFDVSNGFNQFFIRTGISFGMGSIKNFEKTQIW